MYGHTQVISGPLWTTHNVHVDANFHWKGEGDPKDQFDLLQTLGEGYVRALALWHFAPDRLLVKPHVCKRRCDLQVLIHHDVMWCGWVDGWRCVVGGDYSAFGTVYKAKHKDSGIVMALKVINTKGRINLEGDNLVAGEEDTTTLEEIRYEPPPYRAPTIPMAPPCCRR